MTKLIPETEPFPIKIIRQNLPNQILNYCVQLILCLLFLSLHGCKSLNNSPKYKFEDGVYKSKLQGEKQHVYIENDHDSIIVYAINKGVKKLSVDTSVMPKSKTPSKNSLKTIGENKYWQNSFDIDFVTIPLKFRPSTSSFPRQLSNNLNGAVYLGYRNDTYGVSYTKNPIGHVSQKIIHYGFSAGIITGFGTTAMNPYNTNNNISIEYDGMVWTKGIAVLFGVGKFTFGLIGGIDHLLDDNKEYWYYQGKPYLGAAVGLNLN
ncbi:hypothetical protein SAMN04487995_2596 [Dyadobacter koreensis]|uniref:Uncharacterized protein n=1 Tax=Dyadobacter koreensis TaxID=408657 RepID=A0A1H6UKW5_9BACT|nr:hypothetical protein [Dyadobacter koreensis]SEI92951.1 hypothetical protein SAMN04487995_2596 [Dyadobacter koreensis]